MKIAIFSDIHGNVEALRSALKYLDKHKIDNIYCLGDIVGYGPSPNECVEIVRDRCEMVLMGNHDYAAIGLANIDYFNDYAKMSTYWTINHLTDENKDYLRSLPFSHQNDELVMVHSSPTNPSHWYYILSQQDAKIEMESFNQQLCFIGHSHVPVIFQKKLMFRKTKFKLEQNEKTIVNVGSVGQPRDGNPKLCFAIYDDENKTIEYIRLEYDVKKTYKKIVEAGLPIFLAERLLKGY
ncbi:MAG: metallophosphoesterase family protein [Calditrichaceae bacterium]|nr:metallophosphoesterase family protein [Calditrichaceae bacterium]MBN2707540.1 metallophosphoesterase family protein [Calditrichaceae bacterium]RQV95629.1 MAG: metallophosphoesterase [Calditrichota bacterium]